MKNGCWDRETLVTGVLGGPVLWVNLDFITGSFFDMRAAIALASPFIEAQRNERVPGVTQTKPRRDQRTGSGLVLSTAAHRNREGLTLTSTMCQRGKCGRVN